MLTTWLLPYELLDPLELDSEIPEPPDSDVSESDSGASQRLSMAQEEFTVSAIVVIV